MKKLIFTLVFVQIIYSQKQLEYKGNFEGGKAKYSYYENNYERIFNGNFYFNDDYCSVVGEFKKNKKEGIWTYIDGLKANANHRITVTGKYLNDMRDGIWKINSLKDGKSIEYKVLFKNDTIDGILNLPNLEGQFKNGNFIGDWNITKNGKETIVSFNNNSVIKYIERFIDDGKIKIKYLPIMDSIPNAFSTKLTDINNNSEILGYKSITDNQDIVYSLSSFRQDVYNTIYSTISNNCLHRFDSPIFISEPQLLVNKNKIKINSHSQNYPFADRKVISKPRPRYNCTEQGMVVLQITVNRKGQVVSTKNTRETTNNAKCLIESCTIAALYTKFEESPNAPELQIGKLVFNFKLSD